MNTSAFHNIWARLMFFKFSKLHEPQMIIVFFIYNILNKIIKIIKRREEKATITLLWTRNKHKFYSKLSSFRKSSIQKFRIALYNLFMLSSLANQKRDILLSIL